MEGFSPERTWRDLARLVKADLRTGPVEKLMCGQSLRFYLKLMCRVCALECYVSLMRLYLICMACFQEKGKPDTTTYPADLLDEGIANFECRFGHKSRYMIQAFKFEILAEVAVTAIADGYYREAVTSFTSALERFYEFYAKILLKSKGIEKDQIDAFWKRLARQSERQFGAFNMVYLIEEEKPPNVLSDTEVSFRNKVIHQGRVPTRKEAVEYGQKVVDVINEALETIKTKHPDTLEKRVFEDLNVKTSTASHGDTISTYGIPTLFDASIDRGAQRKTVSDWVEHAKGMRDAMRGMSK